MAIKKSELYSSLWSSCDELRGGMDASQYKDYVLVLLFIKYVSDKYAGQPYAPIKIPKGASFKDMAALKGKPDIGDQINKKIIAPLAKENKLSDFPDFPDFNDASKLGSGKEMVEKLTNLIAIFEDPRLDFSKNRAEGDDILGDAYEYLMRHFATESGKSKGQFYTPAEVSRIMAQVIGIRNARTSAAVPVAVDGALYSVGDGHFAQGDSECCGTAIEMGATAVVRFKVHKNEARAKNIVWPRFSHPGFFQDPKQAMPRNFVATMGMPITPDGRNENCDISLAARNAVINMIQLLEERGWTREQAYVLCSVAVDLRVSNVVDVPNVTVSALLPEDIFRA